MHLQHISQPENAFCGEIDQIENRKYNNFLEINQALNNLIENTQVNKTLEEQSIVLRLYSHIYPEDFIITILPNILPNVQLLEKYNEDYFEQRGDEIVKYISKYLNSSIIIHIFSIEELVSLSSILINIIQNIKKLGITLITFGVITTQNKIESTDIRKYQIYLKEFFDCLIHIKSISSSLLSSPILHNENYVTNSTNLIHNSRKITEDRLIKQLARVLFTYIKYCLPEANRKINREISDIERSLTNLGPELLSIENKRKLLFNMGNKFQQIFNNHISGRKYEQNLSFSCEPTINTIFHKFLYKYAEEDYLATEEFTNRDIKKILFCEDCSGCIPGFPSQEGFISITSQLVQKLEVYILYILFFDI